MHTFPPSCGLTIKRVWNESRACCAVGRLLTHARTPVSSGSPSPRNLREPANVASEAGGKQLAASPPAQNRVSVELCRQNLWTPEWVKLFFFFFNPFVLQDLWSIESLTWAINWRMQWYARNSSTFLQILLFLLMLQLSIMSANTIISEYNKVSFNHSWRKSEQVKSWPITQSVDNTIVRQSSAGLGSYLLHSVALDDFITK